MIRREITGADPDLVCLTEAVPDMLPEGGYPLVPGDEAPYLRDDGGQKVLLWSRWPWTESACTLPGGGTGRFAEGVTAAGDGAVRVVGVCIPWHDSHVRTGRADRERWEDHLAYIAALAARERVGADDLPEILLGDYNQRLPRYWQPQHVRDALQGVVDQHDVITAGWDDPKNALIDHIALKGSIGGHVTRVWPKELDGLRLSDHVGIAADIELKPK